MTENVANTASKRNGLGPRLSIIPAAFACDPRPGIWHFRVLNLLGRHTDNAGWCMRSQVKMAAELACTRETVNRTIRDLCDWGYIEKTDQGTTRRSICFYRVVLDPKLQPEVCEPEITDGGECEPEVTGECDPHGHTSVTATVTGGVITAITPITTPVKRPHNNEEEREGASDENARPRSKPPMSLTVAADDSTFRTWIDHLRSEGAADEADAAIAAGTMDVPCRWPAPGDRPWRIPKPIERTLSKTSTRMVGGSAK